MGSTRETRRAGIYLARIAMPLSMRMVIAKVGGSDGSVANKSDVMAFATMKDATVPMATPTRARRRVLEMTLNCTRLAAGTRAMRIPISCVCRETEYEITP